MSSETLSTQFNVEYRQEENSRGNTIGLKVIDRDGELFKQVRTDFNFFPIRFRHDGYPPPFAQGRVALLGEGDHKTVFIDRDGMSDYVIKRYKDCLYKGGDAWEKAQAAAEKIVTIHQVLRDVCGDYYLPFETKVAPYSTEHPDVIAVYEIQQRGTIVSPWLALDPEKASYVDEEAARVNAIFQKIAIPELKSRGLIVASSPTWNLDHLDFYPDYWDLVTDRQVDVDVIDIVYTGTEFPHANIKDDLIVWETRW